MSISTLICSTLDGVQVMDIVAGQNTTFFIVCPPGLEGSKTKEDAWSALPRFPPTVESPDICVVCNEDKPDESPLECERCEHPFHIGCLDPPLDAVPEGEWFCRSCMDGERTLPTRVAVTESDAEDAEPEPEPASKKRAAPTGAAKGKGASGIVCSC